MTSQDVNFNSIYLPELPNTILPCSGQWKLSVKISIQTGNILYFETNTSLSLLCASITNNKMKNKHYFQNKKPPITDSHQTTHSTGT